MAKRKIIKIDADKCTGCSECIPNCPEGALQMIDGKACLVSDLFCDGLGACIGHCPQGAITIEQRDAEAYDEKKVMENIIKQGKNVIKAHLEHLKDHNQMEFLSQAIAVLDAKGIDNPLKASMCHGPEKRGQSGCPGSRMMDFTRAQEHKSTRAHDTKPEDTRTGSGSQLGQWPIQLMLVPPFAPYLDNADLLIAADCVPFAYADFHSTLLRGKVLIIGCPKLDDSAFYKEKIAEIIKNNNMKSITCAHMEVPCCFGLVNIVKSAIADSGKAVPFEEVTITVKGDKI
ncbi:MAG: 4Fe-4S binding protein [Candidatus Omnitrophota bacterium]